MQEDHCLCCLSTQWVGGNSAVWEIVGMLLGGVIVTIVPLLSPAVDQTNKMKVLIQNNHLKIIDGHLQH